MNTYVWNIVYNKILYWGLAAWSSEGLLYVFKNLKIWRVIYQKFHLCNSNFMHNGEALRNIWEWFCVGCLNILDGFIIPTRPLPLQSRWKVQRELYLRIYCLPNKTLDVFVHWTLKLNIMVSKGEAYPSFWLTILRLWTPEIFK